MFLPAPLLRPSAALLGLVLSVSACATASPYTVDSTRCDPPRHQALVGRNVGEIVLPPSLPRRELGPGQRIPQTFNPARLTMFVDAKGWVARVACG